MEWGEAQEKAYQSIKALLTKEPVLRLLDPGKTYFLQTDASDSCIGAVSMQVSSLFIQSSLCTTNRSRATRVHEQSKVCPRTPNELDYVLQSYNFRVEAIKGSENVGADYLSRVEE